MEILKYDVLALCFTLLPYLGPTFIDPFTFIPMSTWMIPKYLLELVKDLTIEMTFYFKIL